MATEPWEAFGIANRPDVSCDFTGSLAADVCDDFGLTCATPNIGGALDGIDIKHMDAMTVIRLSLLEEGAKNGVFYEPIVNAEGQIEFKKIGSGSPSGDIYYRIQMETYREDCSGVMITGKKPLPYRHEIEWLNLFEEAGGYKLWSMDGMTPNCNRHNFRQIAVITYNDPHLSTSYKDGIDNLYEITEENPYDRILGYAYKITPPEDLNDDVTISFENTATVWYHWESIINSNGNPDLGDLIDPPSTTADLECWGGRGLAVEGGKILDLPPELRYETVRDVTTDKLLGVNAIYVVGTECKICKGLPRSDAAAADSNIEGNTDLYVYIDDATDKTFRLDEGIHYIVNYEGDPASRTVKIVFAKNSRPHDNAKFGTEAEFYALPCKYFYENGQGPFRGTILPTGGIKGVWVKDVWVELTLDTPSFKVVDPEGSAHTIAEDLLVEIAPIVMTEEPAPIAKDGREIDLVDGIIDHDPTTTQNLEDTELERAVAEMDRGQGLTLSFSFLNADEVQTLSRVLFNYMNNGSYAETTYICGPDYEVELGDLGDSGGVVNSISYSYSDQGSYTISVNEGPYIIGSLDGITGGPYNKQVESVSAEGVIIQDAGNHIDYKVRLDEVGDVYAINCFPAVLRVGDRVNVSIHNNPVED